MSLRILKSAIFLLLLLVTIAIEASAQAFDISSGGQPTITGSLNGSVTGNTNLRDDLVVNINFGEVSPSNLNSVVKVVVPIGIRSRDPYQVTVSMSGFTNANPQALQASDIGFGIQNIRAMGGGGKVCNQSTHIVSAPFNNDPVNTTTITSSGRVSYQSSLGNLSGSTVILSGPQLSKTGNPNRQTNDGYIFDAIFAVTPAFFATGVSSATIIFSISPGPNVPC
jgi:hypothetical protein